MTTAFPSRSRLWLAPLVICAVTLAGCAFPRTQKTIDYANAPRRVPLVTHEFHLEPHSSVVGEVQVVIARQEDTLADLARAYNLGFDEIVQANPGVDPWLPGEGTPVFLPTQFILPDAPREGLVIDTATMRLFYYPKPKGNKPPVVITHPIGIGRVGWATPTGETKVVAKAKNPSWRVPASVRREHAKNGDPLPAVVPPGPDNPLGNRVLKLGIPGYLIHGTNKPAGVGMRVSHGCVRLYPEDIEALYEQVPIGTPVHIVNQPILIGWRNDVLYLEAHPPLEGKNKERDAALEALVNAVDALSSAHSHDDQTIDWGKIAQVIDEPRGFPIPVSRGSPDLESVLLSARLVENTLPINAGHGNDKTSIELKIGPN